MFYFIKNLRHHLIVLTFILVTLISCSSTQKKAADTESSLGHRELKKAAQQFAKEIGNYFASNPGQGTYVALLPTKGDTTKNLPVDVLDFSLVKELLKKKVYTVRTEDRSKALDEIELQLTGLAEADLNIGKMKTPNYFIKMKIKEANYRQDGESLLEYIVLMEMRNVENQVVVASDIYEFNNASEQESESKWWWIKKFDYKKFKNRYL